MDSSPVTTLAAQRVDVDDGMPPSVLLYSTAAAFAGFSAMSTRLDDGGENLIAAVAIVNV
jgi:hypothetical protein